MSYRALLLLALIGCAPGQPDERSSQAAKDSTALPLGKTTANAVPAVSSGPTATPSAGSQVTVLFFGTSLTAGYGLDPSLAFSNLIEKKSDSTDTPITAINAGLSGETSAGAVRRIAWALRRPVDIVVVETGGNDALRALNPDTLEANLTAIVRKAKEAQPDSRILLAVMEAPPNLGSRYTARFREAYRNVARKEKIGTVPFLLDKVAGNPALNQDDGIHPNEKGERIVADNVWKALRPVVREVYVSRSIR